MRTLVLSNPDVSLNCAGAAFELRQGTRRVVKLPPTAFDNVLVYHGVQLSSGMVSRLGRYGIPVTFLDDHHRVECRLSPPWRLDARPRLAQAAAHLDTASRLKLAKRWVDAKVANHAHLLRLHASNHPDPELASTAALLLKLRPRISSAEALDKLLGLEGYAARDYFSVFGRMLRAEGFAFSGRNRRPPQDPVNALLSYAYATFTRQFQSLAEAHGLDTAIGYLHVPDPQHPALALDMVEPMRAPLADRFALRLLNLKILRPSHFETRMGYAGRGVFLTREGRDLFARAFADWDQVADEALVPSGGGFCRSPSTLILEEVERFHKAAREDDVCSFLPYYWRVDDARWAQESIT